MGEGYNFAMPKVYSIALTAVEPNRKRIDIPGAVPLSELKKTTHA